MKKIIYLLVFCCFFILIGCQDQTKETEPTSDEITESLDSDDNMDNDTQIEDNQQEEKEKETNVTPAPEQEIQLLYRLNEDNWSLEPIEDGIDENVVLLTIDDIPDKHALEMAKILKKLDAPAIFFANGHFLHNEENKEMLRQIHELGFPIGNHTMTHPNLAEISEADQRAEILELNTLIEEIIGEKPKFFRAPHGVNTDFVRELVKQENMLLMNWTYGYDYFEPYKDAEKLTEAMITGKGPEVDVNYSLLKPGANLLMHDREWTLAALEDIVEGLREQGYSFVDPATIELPSE